MANTPHRLLAATLRALERWSSRTGNAAEIAEEVGNSLEVLLSTYAHVIEELRGVSGLSAEALILEARSGHTLVTQDQKLAASPSQ